jgi:hypothetical protein
VSRPVALPRITVTTLPVAREKTGVTLLLAGTGSAYVVDADSGATSVIRGSSGSIAAGRGWWVRNVRGAAVLERLRAPAVLLAANMQYAARAATDATVWVVTAPDDSNVVAQRFETATGHPLNAPVVLPPSATLAGEVPQGLLLQLAGRLALWDTVNGSIRTLGTIEGPVDARGSLVAWAACPTEACGVQLTDTATGSERWVPLENGPEQLAISPDGSRIAAALHSPRRNLGDTAVVDVATGTVAVARASWIDRPTLAWSRDGRRYFVASGLGRSVWMYDADGGREEELHVRVQESIETIAVL